MSLKPFALGSHRPLGPGNFSFERQEYLRAGRVNMKAAAIKPGSFLAGANTTTPWLAVAGSFATVLFYAAVAVFQHRKTMLPPGPRNWPLVGSVFLLSQPLHVCFSRLAEKYGPVFYLKIGMVPAVIVSSPEMASEVLKDSNRSEFSSRPDMTFYECLSYGYNDLAFCPSSSESFKRLRKICSSYLFTSSRLNVTSQIREEDVRACVKCIQESFNGKTVNFSQVLEVTSANSTFRLLFGERFDESETRFLRSLVAAVEDEYTQADIGDLFPFLRPLDIQKKKRKWEKEIMPPLQRFLEMKLANARENKLKKGDAFEASSLVDFMVTMEEADSVADIQLVGLLTNLLLGGLSTQESLLEWTFSELVRNPHVVSKAQIEVDRVVGGNKLVKETDLPYLPYVEAIVKETLRLHPGLPIGAPHFNHVASKIGPYVIPAKTTVFVNIAALGRDPSAWENPLQFNPDRFMSSSIGIAGQSCSFIPFSAGRRMCVGYPLVMRYTALFVASFVQAFELSPPSGFSIEDIDMSEKPTGLCTRAHHLLLTFTPRSRLTR